MDSHVLPFILCNASGVLLFVLGWLAAAKGKNGRLIAAVCALALILLEMVLTWQPVWEARLFPWTSYIYLQDYWIYEIGLLFFGLAIPQLTVRWNRLVVAVVASVVFMAGLRSTVWMIDPETHGQEKTANHDHHYRQTTFYTCAPSSCVSALSYAGISATEREMANLCLTHDTGTTVFNTYRGLTLKLAGTTWHCSVVNRSAEQLMTTGTIAVITELPGFHAITTFGQGTGVEVQDPMLLATAHWSLAQLREHLCGSIAVIIEPTREPAP